MRVNLGVVLLAACSAVPEPGPCDGGAMAYTDAGAAFDTLEEAVDEVLPPTTIRVCPGTFVVDYTAIYGRDEDDEVFVAGAAEGTTLSGGHSSHVFGMISPGRFIQVRDVTLTDGYEDPTECGDPDAGAPCPRLTAGGGLRVARTVALGDSIVVDQNEAQFGAGVGVYEATLTLRDSRVADNHASIAGGAVVIWEGGVLISENTVWEGNTPDDIIFASLGDDSAGEDPDNVVVHATWNVDGRTDFTCRFETLTCE